MVKKVDYKLVVKRVLSIFIISSIVLILINSSNGWTYIKYNDKLYVLNSFPVEKDTYKDWVIENVGEVEKNIPKFSKPIFNNTSNGIPSWTKMLQIKELPGMLIELNGKYLYLGSTEDEGWGNSPKVKIKGNQIMN